ncbi:MAG: hypothetical protein WC683_09620 [bacterium]
MTAAALRRHDTRDKRIERLEAENKQLRDENRKLREKPACTPPPEFMAAYEDAWDRAFGRGKQWVHESTCGGTFSIKRRSFRGVLKDERGLDDILMLDRLFRALAIAVRLEAGRRDDIAAWHKDVDRLTGGWRERYKKGA